MTEFAIVRWDTYLSKDKSTIYPVVYIKRDKDFIDHFERNKFRMQCKVSDTKTDYDGEQLYQGIILNEAKEVFSGDDKYLKDASYILIILKTRFIEHVPFHLGKITVVDFNLEEEKKQQEQLAEIVKKLTENFNNADAAQKKAKSDFDIITAEYSRLKSLSDGDPALINSAQETLTKATKDASDAVINLETSKINLKKAQDDVLTLTSTYNQISNDSANFEISLEKAKKISESAALESENSKTLLISASNAYNKARQDADIAIDIANRATMDATNSIQKAQDLRSNSGDVTPSPLPIPLPGLDPVKVAIAKQAADDANLKISIRDTKKQDLDLAQEAVNKAVNKASTALDNINKALTISSQALNAKQTAENNLSNGVSKTNKYLEDVKNSIAAANSTSNSLAMAVENSKVVNNNALKNSANTKKVSEDLVRIQVVLNTVNDNLQVDRTKLDIAIENKKTFDDSLKPLVPTVVSSDNSRALQQQDSKPVPPDNTLTYVIITVIILIILILIYNFVYKK